MRVIHTHVYKGWGEVLAHDGQRYVHITRAPSGHTSVYNGSNGVIPPITTYARKCSYAGVSCVWWEEIAK